MIPTDIFQPRLRIFSAQFTNITNEYGDRIVEITIINNDNIEYDKHDIQVRIMVEHVSGRTTIGFSHDYIWNQSGSLQPGEKETKEFEEPDYPRAETQGLIQTTIVTISYDEEDMDSQQIPYTYERKRFFEVGIIMAVISWTIVFILMNIYFKERSEFNES